MFIRSLEANKMKGVVIVCLVAVISSAKSSTDNDLMQNLKLKYVGAYLQQRQAIDQMSSRMEQICPGSKTKFESAVEEMKNCADKIDETAETSCSIAKNRLPKCMVPVINMLKDCMPQESKEIPQFLLDSILKGVDYLCKTDGEHVFELANTCLHTQNPFTQTCKRKFTMKMQLFHRKGLGVNEVCSLMTYMRPCLKSHFSFSCGSPITQEAIMGLYDAFLTNCEKKETTTENGIQSNLLEDFS